MRDLHKSVILRMQFAALLAFVVAALVSAQTLSPGEVRLSSRPYQPRQTLRAATNLVQLEVVVRDSHGRAVPGLTKDNFAVYDSGKPRDPTSFSVEITNSPNAATAESVHTLTPANVPPVPETSQPTASTQNIVAGRWICVLFDDINTNDGDLGHAKIASTRFVKEAAAAGDRIAVFTSSAGGTLGFTTDTSAVLAKIASVQSHLRVSARSSAQCPRISPYEAYQIVNKDPITMQAKVNEGCHCADSEPCPAAAEGDPHDLLNPASQDLNQDAEVGGGVLREVVIKVQAQAQQTWNQARMASQASMDAIGTGLDYLTKAPGKRILLIATSGFLSGTLEEQQDAITNEALRAGVVINSIDAKGLYAEAPGPPIDQLVQSGDSILNLVNQTRSLGDQLNNLDAAGARFAESTGGLLFRDNNDLDLGFRELGIAPAYAYVLGFPPSEDGKYHKVKVELKNGSHNFIQVRPGYFAPTTKSSAPLTSEDKLDAEILASDDRTDLPATFTEETTATGSGNRQLTIQSHVDIQKLPFELQKDRHVEKLTFVAALFNAQGQFITGKEADMDLALMPASFDRFSKTGISGAMSLEALIGTYRLRTVVQEAVHGDIAASSKEIQIQ
jgi:VWFA-related protein